MNALEQAIEKIEKDSRGWQWGQFGTGMMCALDTLKSHLKDKAIVILPDGMPDTCEECCLYASCTRSKLLGRIGKPDTCPIFTIKEDTP